MSSGMWTTAGSGSDDGEGLTGPGVDVRRGDGAWIVGDGRVGADGAGSLGAAFWPETTIATTRPATAMAPRARATAGWTWPVEEGCRDIGAMLPSSCCGRHRAGPLRPKSGSNLVACATSVDRRVAGMTG